MVGGSQNLPGCAVGKSMRIRFANPLPGLSVGSSTERCQRRVPPSIAPQDSSSIPAGGPRLTLGFFGRLGELPLGPRTPQRKQTLGHNGSAVLGQVLV